MPNQIHFGREQKPGLTVSSYIDINHRMMFRATKQPGNIVGTGHTKDQAVTRCLEVCEMFERNKQVSRVPRPKFK